MPNFGSAARAAACAICFVCAAAAWGQGVDDVIRMRVEELRATGALEVLAEPFVSPGTL